MDNLNPCPRCASQKITQSFMTHPPVEEFEESIGIVIHKPGPIEYRITCDECTYGMLAQINGRNDVEALNYVWNKIWPKERGGDDQAWLDAFAREHSHE